MIKSIREELIKISQSNVNDSSTIISKEIIKNYDNYIFLSQKELANKCFVSESLITYFAKKMNYTGYRELVSRLKLERDLYNMDNPIKLEDNSIGNYRQEFEKTLSSIDAQNLEIIKTIDFLKNAKRIFILSSYDQVNNAESLFNIMQIQGKDVHFSKYRKTNGYYVNELTEEDAAFFLVSGLDNNSLVNYYERLFKNNCKRIVVVSNSQAYKFKEPDSLIVIQNIEKHEIYETARSSYIYYLLNFILINI
ncbi:MurR/RpiR family transcriptional regulator [Spiroplasma cantharicola]|uniref:HTH rpiR-type domain-containing protein n=1 Tax=Spiroplasma cantharicola TaxID=362837 RepID=A0A0M3SJ95_9MOLU|nr:MurR/RpiR family transcriptional regulator [Spiroplasma cantharicola]ALD66344.1 hypothetical protein SCANT_v1c04380 [Spiroplasma cantharicola]